VIGCLTNKLAYCLCQRPSEGLIDGFGYSVVVDLKRKDGGDDHFFHAPSEIQSVSFFSSAKQEIWTLNSAPRVKVRSSTFRLTILKKTFQID
jgi:hypothetical protein